MAVELGSKDFWDMLAADPRKLAVEVCKVDIRMLDLTLQHHPALRAWVNAAHEMAKVEEERALWGLRVARARAVLASAGTVQEREAQTELAEGVKVAQEAVFLAQEKRGALRAMASALEDRKDMLIQIAAKRRKEQDDYNH